MNVASMLSSAGYSCPALENDENTVESCHSELYLPILPHLSRLCRNLSKGLEASSDPNLTRKHIASALLVIEIKGWSGLPFYPSADIFLPIEQDTQRSLTPLGEIEKQFPPQGSLRLYRLVKPASFTCRRCSLKKTSKLVAYDKDSLDDHLCNGCYGSLQSNKREQMKAPEGTNM